VDLVSFVKVLLPTAIMRCLKIFIVQCSIVVLEQMLLSVNSTFYLYFWFLFRYYCILLPNFAICFCGFIHDVRFVSPIKHYSLTYLLTLWRPLLSYGYSCKASCARLG